MGDTVEQAAVAALPAGDQSWSLDGTWDLLPGDHEPGALGGLEPRPIQVPGLWEAQGFLDLDGVAWYRRRFAVDDPGGHWTLRGAVMDLAEVYLNGRLLGGNDLPFTPFSSTPPPPWPPGPTSSPSRSPTRRSTPPSTGGLRQAGLGQPRLPQPPSLYLTYGGIWQPVTLRRHGPVALRGVRCSSDPGDLTVAVRVENVGDGPVAVRLEAASVGWPPG